MEIFILLGVAFVFLIPFYFLLENKKTAVLFFVVIILLSIIAMRIEIKQNIAFNEVLKLFNKGTSSSKKLIEYSKEKGFYIFYYSYAKQFLDKIHLNPFDENNKFVPIMGRQSEFFNIIYIFPVFVIAPIITTIILFLFPQTFGAGIKFVIRRRVFLILVSLIAINIGIIYLLKETKWLGVYFFPVWFVGLFVKGGISQNYWLILLAIPTFIVWITLQYKYGKQILPKLFIQKYTRCPKCGYKILIYLNWQCVESIDGHYQEKERYITAKCNECGLRLEKTGCEHCGEEIYL